MYSEEIRLRSETIASYELDFRASGEKGEDLVVVFSPKGNFSLYRYKLPFDTLYFADKMMSYYLINPGRQCTTLGNFIVAKKYKRVIFIGSSKGATGALVWSSLIYGMMLRHRVSIRCLAFSPQTSIYPLNPNLAFPSYKALIVAAKQGTALKTCLERYGEVYKMVETSGVPVTAIYPSENHTDRIESLRLSSSNVEHWAIPFTFHGAITPFIVDRDDIDKTVEALFKKSSTDKDLKTTLPASKEDLAKQFQSFSAPSLRAYICETLDSMTHL